MSTNPSTNPCSLWMAGYWDVASGKATLPTLHEEGYFVPDDLDTTDPMFTRALRVQDYYTLGMICATRLDQGEWSMPYRPSPSSVRASKSELHRVEAMNKGDGIPTLEELKGYTP